MLLLIVLITHFTRTQPRLEAGKRADCCVRGSSEGDLVSIEEEEERNFVKILSKNSQ